jgi:hypothetical protein
MGEPRGFAGRAPRAAGILGHTQAPSFRPVAGQTDKAASTTSDLAKKALRVDYRLAGWGMNLRIQIFRTRSAGNLQEYPQELIAKARAIYSPHGLNLVVRDSTNEPLPRTDDPATTDEQIEEVIRRAEEARRGAANYCLVIFCPSTTITSGNPQTEAGRTLRGAAGARRAPVVLINTLTKKRDRSTLAHELGHAAQLHHVDEVPRVYGMAAVSYLAAHGVDLEQNFMGEDGDRKNRKDMFAYQVDALGSAFFAGPGNIEE